MNNIYKSGEDFLNKKYKELFFNDIVESIKDKGDTRDEALRKYLKLLEETHNNVYSSKRESDRNLLKRLYYSKYIIKEEDITESYWSFLNQQYVTETGYELNEELKQEHTETIIKDQKASLDAWLDYLSCEDSKFYPMWAKYWAFQGMLTIGTYDNKNEIYKKRTKDTVAPFIELNQEVLAKCIDYIVKYVEHNEVNEKDLEQIITSGNFFKLYTVLISKFKEITYDKESIDGIWVKYEQGDNYKPLYNSLQGYATGWCTAGEDTCKKQVEQGDFYVYYTYDKEGNPKIPRIAIRMNGKNIIAEIRGVADNQNLESHLENVLEEKLKEFPDRDEYKQRIEDQKTLTYIYEKHKSNIDFTKEELEFIYEIKRKISRFGYKDDPRKQEILENRSKTRDYSFICDCEESEISYSQEEYKNNPSKYKLLFDELIIKSQKELTEVKVLPKFMMNNLYLNCITTPKDLDLPKIIVGDLYLKGLTTAEGLVFSEIIKGNIILNNLRYGKGLILPETVGGDLCLDNLIDVEGVKFPKKIDGNLELYSLEIAKKLILPEIVGASLILYNLKSAKGVIFPRMIGGSLCLDDLESAEGLLLPESIGGYLSLVSLKSAKGLVLPRFFIGILYLSNLTTSEGLELPENYDLNKLLCPDHIKQELIEKRNKGIHRK